MVEKSRLAVYQQCLLRINSENLGSGLDSKQYRHILSRLLLVAGGTQVSDALARHCGLDVGFGRGATVGEVASFLVRALREREK